MCYSWEIFIEAQDSAWLTKLKINMIYENPQYGRQWIYQRVQKVARIQQQKNLFKKYISCVPCHLPPVTCHLPALYARFMGSWMAQQTTHRQQQKHCSLKIPWHQKVLFHKWWKNSRSCKLVPFGGWLPCKKYFFFFSFWWMKLFFLHKLRDPFGFSWFCFGEPAYCA